MKKGIFLAITTSFLLSNCNMSQMPTSGSDGLVSPMPDGQEVQKYHDNPVPYNIMVVGSDSKVYRYVVSEWQLLGNTKLTRVGGCNLGYTQWGINSSGKILYHPSGQTEWIQYPNQLPSGALAADIASGLSSIGDLVFAVGTGGTLYYIDYNWSTGATPAWTKVTAVSNVSKVSVSGAASSSDPYHIWVTFKGNSTTVTRLTYPTWEKATTNLPSGIYAKDVGAWLYPSGGYGVYVTTTTNKLYQWKPTPYKWEVFTPALPGNGTAIEVSVDMYGVPYIINTNGKIWWCSGGGAGGGTWYSIPGKDANNVGPGTTTGDLSMTPCT